MRWIKKILIGLLIALTIPYVLVCAYLFFFQENLLFFPEKTDKDYQFQFVNEFVENDIITLKGDTINTLLFKQENSKGVIFYLHGNSGNLKSVGKVSQDFLPLGFDVFMMDYQGYGKSSGQIETQAELYSDVQTVYDELKKSYTEDQIIILGYSIGTGIAAHVASTNHPVKLILHAPYYNMADMMKRNYPIIPTFILDYTLETNQYLKKCNMPVYLFHGVDDTVIPVESSEMLSAEFDIPLYRLEQQAHNNLSSNRQALDYLTIILND